VIDIQQLSQLLKMIHFEATTSLLPQVLRSIFRAHVGLAPLLTLFLLPGAMTPLLRHVLPVWHLARIISRIPMREYLRTMAITLADSNSFEIYGSKSDIQYAMYIRHVIHYYRSLQALGLVFGRINPTSNVQYR
jgi:hypothetical protein